MLQLKLIMSVSGVFHLCRCDRWNNELIIIGYRCFAMSTVQSCLVVFIHNAF